MLLFFFFFSRATLSKKGKADPNSDFENFVLRNNSRKARIQAGTYPASYDYKQMEITLSMISLDKKDWKHFLPRPTVGVLVCVKAVCSHLSI